VVSWLCSSSLRGLVRSESQSFRGTNDQPTPHPPSRSSLPTVDRNDWNEVGRSGVETVRSGGRWDRSHFTGFLRPFPPRSHRSLHSLRSSHSLKERGTSDEEGMGRVVVMGRLSLRSFLHDHHHQFHSRRWLEGTVRIIYSFCRPWVVSLHYSLRPLSLARPPAAHYARR